MNAPDVRKSEDRLTHGRRSGAPRVCPHVGLGRPSRSTWLDPKPESAKSSLRLQAHAGWQSSMNHQPSQADRSRAARHFVVLPTAIGSAIFRQWLSAARSRGPSAASLEKSSDRLGTSSSAGSPRTAPHRYVALCEMGAQRQAAGRRRQTSASQTISRGVSTVDPF